MLLVWKKLAEIQSRLKGRRVLVITDFDGTLTEIVYKPHAARLSAARRRLLLSFHDGTKRLSVVTGRGIEDIRERVGIPDIPYGANCGLEIDGAGKHFIHAGAVACRGSLVALADALRADLLDFPTFKVQDKRWSIGLPEPKGLDKRRAAKVAEILRRHRHNGRSRGLHWYTRGEAWEILPDLGWTKGKAARLIWQRLGKPFLIGLGDDEIDEPLFAFAERHGFAVRVGKSKSSCASYYVRDVHEVYRFLKALKSPSKA